MTDFRLVTADDLCHAFETILTAKLPVLIEQLGLDEELAPISGGALGVKTWQQVPDLKALVPASFPAGAITSPGLADRPTRKPGGAYDAVWRIAVGIYDRGRDHAETARRARTWGALVRAVMLANPSVGGLASGLRWAGEDYGQTREREAARTLGGCAVSFNVGVSNVVDLSALDPEVLTVQTLLDVPST